MKVFERGYTLEVFTDDRFTDGQRDLDVRFDWVGPLLSAAVSLMRASEDSLDRVEVWGWEDAPGGVGQRGTRLWTVSYDDDPSLVCYEHHDDASTCWASVEAAVVRAEEMDQRTLEAVR